MATSTTERAGAAPTGVVPPPATEPDPRFELLDRSLKKARYAQDELIELLHAAQDVFGYLSPEVLGYLARELRLPPSRVFGVASFYHLFSFAPSGAHTCTVCTGTACFVKGADGIVARIEAEHGVLAGGTTADGRLGLSTGRCLGSCGLAPVVVIDGVVHGNLGPDEIAALVREAIADDGGGES
jgi:bidirectional [NiFe] hydrogenase diaphorase subunit